MHLGESVRMAFETIRAHKLRSFLTLLGIIIGVAAVIGMMSIIRGLQLELERQMTILQPSVFQVQKWPMVARMGPGNFEREPRPDITAEYAEAIRERCPAVSLVGPEVWQFGVSARRGESTTSPVFTMAGGTPEFFPNNGYYVGEGRAVTQGDLHHNRMVAVVGVQLVEDLFPHEDPLGKEIKIVFRPFRFFFEGELDDPDFVYSHKFTVVGVLEERGSMMGDNKDDRIVIPFSTFEKIYGRGRSINITIQARRPELFAEAQDQVVALMRGLRGLRPGEPDDFALYSSEMGIQTFNQMTGSVKYAAVGICAVSLLVAGIGIMNIMLVSVNERTREIGIRKALGARRRDILGQFVVEAVVLSEIGGVLGVGVGLALGLTLGSAVPALRAAVPLWAVLLGLGFCSLVGLFFGIYPAGRAARLDPIVALHYE